MAFDASGNLFVAEANSNSIDKITSGGSVSTFATGLNAPLGLAFGAAPIPEPSTWAMLAGGFGSLLAFRRRR